MNSYYGVMSAHGNDLVILGHFLFNFVISTCVEPALQP